MLRESKVKKNCNIEAYFGNCLNKEKSPKWIILLHDDKTQPVAAKFKFGFLSVSKTGNEVKNDGEDLHCATGPIFLDSYLSNQSIQLAGCRKPSSFTYPQTYKNGTVKQLPAMHLSCFSLRTWSKQAAGGFYCSSKYSISIFGKLILWLRMLIYVYIPRHSP